LKTARRGSGTGKRKEPATVECDEWTYENKDPKSPLYYGSYKLYTRVGEGGVPVRFSFVGKNVILGTSHYDNYTIDYFDYQTLEEVDDFWLYPPRGMPCLDHSQATGPVTEHANSLKNLFPESAQTRQDLYDEFRSKHGKPGPVDSLERENLFHATQRMIEVHNRSPDKSYDLGLNFMADWTPEERSRQVCFLFISVCIKERKIRLICYSMLGFARSLVVACRLRPMKNRRRSARLKD